MRILLWLYHVIPQLFIVSTCTFSGSADGTIRIWDMEIGDCVLLLTGHSGPITDLSASADGRILVSASADGTARAWELEKGQCTALLRGVPPQNMVIGVWKHSAS